MQRRNSGFTLVEMLAVAVLTALLMVAAMGVISSLARSKVRPVGSNNDWHSILQADLASARSVLGGERLLITGMGLMDAAGNRTQRPARVEYAVESIGKTSWLVRYQTSLSDRGDGQRERFPLLPNINQFTAQPLLGIDQDETAVPHQLRISLNNQTQVVTGW